MVSANPPPPITQRGSSTGSAEPFACTGKKVIVATGALLGAGLIIFACTKLGPASLAGRVCLGTGACVSGCSGVLAVSLLISRRAAAGVLDDGVLAAPVAAPGPKISEKTNLAISKCFGTEERPLILAALIALDESKIYAITQADHLFFYMDDHQSVRAVQTLALLGIDTIDVIGRGRSLFRGMDGDQCLQAVEALASLNISDMKAIEEITRTEIFRDMSGGECLQAIQTLAPLNTLRLNEIGWLALGGVFNDLEGGQKLSLLQRLAGLDPTAISMFSTYVQQHRFNGRGQSKLDAMRSLL